MFAILAISCFVSKPHVVGLHQIRLEICFVNKEQKHKNSLRRHEEWAISFVRQIRTLRRYLVYESMREMVPHGRDLNNSSEYSLIKGLRKSACKVAKYAPYECA